MLENHKISKIKSSLLAGLIINGIVLLLLSILIYLLVPSIEEISEKKKDTNLLFADYSKTTKQWLAFSDFNSKKAKLTDLDSYKKNILANLDAEFYNKYFVNKWTNSYEIFLNDLKKSTNEKISSKEFKAKQELISTILPVYSNSALMDWTITDSTFINNVENLIDEFNLSTKDSISVSNITPIEEPLLKNKKTRKSLLDSEIYYFTLPLKLTWTKRDIIDFIHYLENVGSINISWNDIKVYKDSISNYEWQIAEISAIRILSYLDSDTSTISSWDFLSFVKNTQWNEKLDIDLSINFYVKWLASYKVQDYINTLNLDYTKLSKEVAVLISKIDQKDANLISVFNKLTSMKRYLDTIKKDISDLVSKSKKADDIGSVYSQAYKFTSTIENLSSLLKSQKIIIESLKSNKK